eukprot:760614-Hanusia_phi.AAC.4
MRAESADGIAITTERELPPPVRGQETDKQDGGVQVEHSFALAPSEASSSEKLLRHACVALLPWLLIMLSPHIARTELAIASIPA